MNLYKSAVIYEMCDSPYDPTSPSHFTHGPSNPNTVPLLITASCDNVVRASQLVSALSHRLTADKRYLPGHAACPDYV